MVPSFLAEIKTGPQLALDAVLGIQNCSSAPKEFAANISGKLIFREIKTRSH
jgi:hypothetical protein